MQACLGLFVFSLTTAPLSDRQRSTNWRHARSEPIGQRATSEYIGPGEDRITLNGQITHDIAGTVVSLDVLRAMADTGEAYVFVLGTGQVLGAFTIEDLQESSTRLFPDGTPRAVEFSITLVRTTDDLVDKLALYTSALALL
ncbi:phage tail protein [Oceanobacter kriegii]|uniref:phage tail protein n=1 Tax=Oceanobacter kriegii TaxID=64972 RepID=UPI000480B8B7|nr:phage tail protein [Oceanobacter kriegii]